MEIGENIESIIFDYISQIQGDIESLIGYNDVNNYPDNFFGLRILDELEDALDVNIDIKVSTELYSNISEQGEQTKNNISKKAQWNLKK